MLPFSASIAADELHRSLDLSQNHRTVLKQFEAALQAAYDRGKADVASPEQVAAFNQLARDKGWVDEIFVTIKRSHLKQIRHDCRGGNADLDTVELLRWLAPRLHKELNKEAGVDMSKILRERASRLEVGLEALRLILED